MWSRSSLKLPGSAQLTNTELFLHPSTGLSHWLAFRSRVGWKSTRNTVCTGACPCLSVAVVWGTETSGRAWRCCLSLPGTRDVPSPLRQIRSKHVLCPRVNSKCSGCRESGCWHTGHLMKVNADLLQAVWKIKYASRQVGCNTAVTRPFLFSWGFCARAARCIPCALRRLTLPFPFAQRDGWVFACSMPAWPPCSVL